MAKGIKILKGKKTEELEISAVQELIGKYQRVLADLGTGDGLFALRYAEAHPDTLVLAIDAAAESMKPTAAKALKLKRSNILFIWSAVEKLPLELANTADEILINFPWGNLLADTVKAKPHMLSAIVNFAKRGAKIIINLSYHPHFEQGFVSEYELPELTQEYFDQEFAEKIKPQSLLLMSARKIDSEDESIKQSSWPKRILSNRTREVWQLKLKIRKGQGPIEKVQREEINRDQTLGHSYLDIGHYTFTCYGHPAIRATHVKTLEFTKDPDLTERGDCIIGIKADFDLNELKKFTKKVKFICSVTTPTGETITSEFKAKVNQNFNSDHELVLRKSGFDTERTFGFGLNRGANHLDRRIVELMQNPEQKMQVTIQEGWS